MPTQAVVFTGGSHIPVWFFAVVVQLELYGLRRPQSSGFVRTSMGLSLLLLACACSGSATHAESAGPVFAVLVFTKTVGFRHASIPAGIAAIKSLGHEQDFRVDTSEDAAVFTEENLVRYRVIVFLNTTGDILDLNQQAAVERFIQHGGEFVGIHAATDTEYDWAWYGRLVGASFANHPPIQMAVVRVVDATHPSTAQLPAVWTRSDEWYNFRAAPSPHVHVLMEVALQRHFYEHAL